MKTHAKKKIVTKKSKALPKRSDRLESEEKLFDTGLKLFSEKGFDGTSVHEISKVSGVNVSLIHRYFGGKEGLLWAITERDIKQMQKRVHTYPPQTTAREELKEYALAEIQATKADLPKVRLLCGQAITNPNFQQKLISIIETMQDDEFLSERLERLKKIGKVKKSVNVFETQLLFGYQLFGIILLSMIVLSLKEQETEVMIMNFVDRYADSIAN
jgi:AcrR family transcriptional regulator